MDDVAPATVPRPGQPRSERDAAFLKRFNAWMQVPIVVSAILPLVIIPESNGWVGIVVGVVTWLVFLVDYVVHARHLERYGRTGFGRFDLFVVIATAPWFLIPGAQAGQFVVLLRLARLARLVMATKGARRLFERLGRVAIAAGGVVVIGSLASFFRLDDSKPSAGSPPADEAGHAAATPSDAALQALAAEVSALRHQVDALAAWLTGTLPSQAQQEPAGDEDARHLTSSAASSFRHPRPLRGARIGPP